LCLHKKGLKDARKKCVDARKEKDAELSHFFIMLKSRREFKEIKIFLKVWGDKSARKVEFFMPV